jgi:hypothetical protein
MSEMCRYAVNVSALITGGDLPQPASAYAGSRFRTFPRRGTQSSTARLRTTPFVITCSLRKPPTVAFSHGCLFLGSVLAKNRRRAVHHSERPCCAASHRHRKLATAALLLTDTHHALEGCFRADHVDLGVGETHRAAASRSSALWGTNASKLRPRTAPAERPDGSSGRDNWRDRPQDVPGADHMDRGANVRFARMH